jgi:putative ATPase
VFSVCCFFPQIACASSPGHRFNRAQQDLLLPLVEQGTITLLGATTENPSFSLNSALLSRCRVFALHKLEKSHVCDVLLRAVYLKNQDLKNDSPSVMVSMDEDSLSFMADLSNGDARAGINLLDVVIDSAVSQMLSQENLQRSLLPVKVHISKENIARGAMNRQPLLYDKSGEEHFNLISALHKSMRGGNPDASLYWLMRMLAGGEDPMYLSRRLIRFASEDVGLADKDSLNLAMATHYACANIGMPECEVSLAHCVTYLARAPKDIAVYEAMKKAKSLIAETPAFPVPLHLRNAPTHLMKVN